jgi:hypothetical protein
MRFLPSFFLFTEPSLEVDISAAATRAKSVSAKARTAGDFGLRHGPERAARPPTNPNNAPLRHHPPTNS